MENPSTHLHELCAHIAETSGVQVSEATVCRLIRRHGLTRKKVRQVALQRSLRTRALFMAQVLSFPRELHGLTRLGLMLEHMRESVGTL